MEFSTTNPLPSYTDAITKVVLGFKQPKTTSIALEPLEVDQLNETELSESPIKGSICT